MTNMQLRFFFALLVVLTTCLVLSSQVVAHAHVGEEAWLVSSYVNGDLALNTDENAPQWQGTYMMEVESMGHMISVMSVNNGTHVYFHLSWNDTTSTDDDGAAVFFEGAGKGGEDDVWYWSTISVPSLENAGVTSQGEWGDGEWMAVIARQLSIGVQDTVSLEVGKPMMDFMKFALWDGSAGESFDTIDPEQLSHLNFVILPFIDLHPRDVYVWSGLVAIGAVTLAFVELRNYGKKAGVYGREE